MSGWRARAMASGAERDPGETQAVRTPRRTNSSTNAAAKRWFAWTPASDWVDMPDLEIPDGNLHYEAAGPEDAETVTLLHGFTQTSRSWRELIGYLPPDFRYLIPDLRGHGATKLRPRAPHTMGACTEDLLALWHQEGVEKTHLVGYSMG